MFFDILKNLSGWRETALPRAGQFLEMAKDSARSTFVFLTCRLTRPDGAIPPASGLHTPGSNDPRAKHQATGAHNVAQRPWNYSLATPELFSLPCLAFLGKTPIKALA